jgi:hypothetical protein
MQPELRPKLASGLPARLDEKHQERKNRFSKSKLMNDTRTAFRSWDDDYHRVKQVREQDY